MDKIVPEDNKCFIITCGCGDTDEFALAGFKLMAPNCEVPPIIHISDDNRIILETLLEMASMEQCDKIDLDSPFALFIGAKRVTVWEMDSNESEEMVDYSIYDLLEGEQL